MDDERRAELRRLAEVFEEKRSIANAGAALNVYGLSEENRSKRFGDYVIALAEEKEARDALDAAIEAKEK
jgi:hypothetical protein